MATSTGGGKHLAESKLLDKVAVDIKAGPDHYSRLAGVSAPAMDQSQRNSGFFASWTIRL